MRCRERNINVAEKVNLTSYTICLKMETGTTGYRKLEEKSRMGPKSKEWTTLSSQTTKVRYFMTWFEGKNKNIWKLNFQLFSLDFLSHFTKMTGIFYMLLLYAYFVCTSSCPLLSNVKIFVRLRRYFLPERRSLAYNWIFNEIIILYVLWYSS